jgi:hypothetical protein
MVHIFNFFIRKNKRSYCSPTCISVKSLYCTSRLEAHVGFFRLLMKEIFGPYVLWQIEKKTNLSIFIHLYLYMTSPLPGLQCICTNYTYIVCTISFICCCSTLCNNNGPIICIALDVTKHNSAHILLSLILIHFFCNTIVLTK